MAGDVPELAPESSPARQALENTVDFLEQIEGVAHIGAWKLNPESEWLMWSKGMFDMLGHPVNEAPSLASGMAYFAPACHERVIAALADSWNTGSPFQLNVELVTREGGRILGELRCSGRVDRNNQSFLAGSLLDVTERHAMLDRALATEARQRQWLASLPDGWLELSVEGKISLANRAAGAMFGILPEAMIGMRIEQLFPALMDESLHAVNNQTFPVFRVLLSGCAAQPSVFGVKDRQGKLQWTEIHVAPLLDEQGALNGCSLLIRDINALRRVEQQQRHERQTLAEIEEIASLGHWRLYIPTDKIQYSEQCRQIIGLPAGQGFSTQSFIQCVYPNDLPALSQAWHTARNDGQLDIECRITTPGGTLRWIRLIARVARNRVGKAYSANGVIQDVTERHRAEEELYKISFAIEQSPNPLLITDSKGRIEYVNNAFERLSGYSRSESLGLNPNFLSSGLTPRETYAELWGQLKAGKHWQGELINRKKSGEVYTEYVFISPIRQSDGRITHYLAHKEDVSERQKLAGEQDIHRHHPED